MTNEEIAKEVPPENKSWPDPKPVTTDDLRAVPFQEVIKGVLTVHDYDLESAFTKEAKASINNSRDYHVYRLLAGCCSIHLNIDERASKFGPRVAFANGDRSPIPDDYRGHQNDQIYEILDDIAHPALRARLADIVWTNDRKKGQAAKIAVEAYCECVEGLENGYFKPSFEAKGIVSLEMIDLLRRAAQIHSATSKRDAPLHPRIVELALRLFDAAQGSSSSTPYIQLAALVMKYHLLDFDEIASRVDAAAVASDNSQESYPVVTQQLFDMAAFAFDQCDKPEDSRRCRLASAEQHLKMAGQVGNASAAVYWYRQAIKAFKSIPNTTERRDQLRKELAALQEESLTEFGSFSTKIDLDDLVAETRKEIEALSLSDTLKTIALMAQPEKASKLRAQAIKANRGLAGMFGATHLDSDGKVIAEVEAIGLGEEEPNEAWIKSKIVEHINLRIHIVLNSRLEPARTIFSSYTGFAERDFEVIVWCSPFVPETHKATLTLGFARLFQGDTLSASALLIPQLEHCVRHALIISSLDTSRMRDDLIQEDRSLSAIFDLYRADLTRIFGESIVLYIELLFIHRPGAALRHEFAHGKTGDRALYDPAILFACYFIFYLVCAPLFSMWDEHVSPNLEQ